MTIKEVQESKKYADLETSDIESVPGYLEKDVNDFESAEMNGCEFYLYLQKDYPAWQEYEDYGEEAKEEIRKEALEMYGYTEEDVFLVFFRG